ncbi:transcription factor UPBEAT1 [Senna tora]|uniref:Transcription factor UPBEAT1 n=1 Tax=Senna tora TaxID=362788 RepID=A0A834WCC0_9FABA|nr:transcription factor UPBEAT1 [Senna tora]
MGVSSQPFLASLSLEDLLQVQGTSEESKNSSSYGDLWRKVIAAKKQKKKSNVKSRRQGRNIVMKRRGRLMERGKNNIIDRKVRTLKRLVPKAESLGLDGLFRETAHYILSLQMRVRVMQIMVKAAHDGTPAKNIKGR